MPAFLAALGAGGGVFSQLCNRAAAMSLCVLKYQNTITLIPGDLIKTEPQKQSREKCNVTLENVHSDLEKFPEMAVL